MSPMRLVLACVVLLGIYGYEQVESRPTEAESSFDSRFKFVSGRSRRQAEGPPPSFYSGSSSFDGEPIIPKISPPPSGSILTYDGKPISTSIGAFSIVPKSEGRTPSINLNRPQYATFRGQLPPKIPDIVPRDLPQFKDNKGAISNFPPAFN